MAKQQNSGVGSRLNNQEHSLKYKRQSKPVTISLLKRYLAYLNRHHPKKTKVYRGRPALLTDLVKSRIEKGLPVTITKNKMDSFFYPFTGHVWDKFLATERKSEYQRRLRLNTRKLRILDEKYKKEKNYAHQEKYATADLLEAIEDIVSRSGGSLTKEAVIDLILSIFIQLLDKQGKHEDIFTRRKADSPEAFNNRLKNRIITIINKRN